MSRQNPRGVSRGLWASAPDLLSPTHHSCGGGVFATEQEIFAGASFIGVAIVLVFLVASIRTVREGEFLAVFRLGRGWKVVGPGLAVIIPLIDRTVRVAVPVGMVDLGAAKDLLRVGKAPSSAEVPGHTGLTIAEVCLRAAILARQGNSRTRKATVEQFQEALRGLAGRAGRRS